MDDIETERAIRGRYPLWTLLMVKAAKKALEEKRARIEEGFLIVDPLPTSMDPRHYRRLLDGDRKRKVPFDKARMNSRSGPNGANELS
jgi:hypothetical protein